MSHGFGNAAEDCPFCTAKAADRIRHVAQCGGIFLWLQEALPGLQRPLDASVARVSAFFSCLGNTSLGGAVMCLVHDIIHTAAKSACVNAVAGRSALIDRLRAVMSGSTVVANILTDFDVQL